MTQTSFIFAAIDALGLDPLENGLQILDASAFVAIHTEKDAPAWSNVQNVGPYAPTLVPFPLVATRPVLDASAFVAIHTEKDAPAWSNVQNVGPYAPTLVPFPLVATRPALICRFQKQHIDEVARSLRERYPADHPIRFIQVGLQGSSNRVWETTLVELHQQELDENTCAYLAPLAPLADLRGPEGPTLVVARLLGPKGCPWDHEQTHQSLRPALLEEAYEVLESLDAGDMNALAEELGDLLLAVLVHSEMARQAGSFSLNDVYGQVAAKFIRRHPHVFGTTDVAGTEDVLRNWEAIKQAERAAKGQQKRGPLDGIPAALPALMAAQTITRKAAKQGFDWPSLDGAWDKFFEELQELRVETETSSADTNARRIEEELGDVLFALANLARRLHVDAESALRAAGAKFRRRFAYVEQQLHAQGRALAEAPLDEMIAIWNQAKAYDE